MSHSRGGSGSADRSGSRGGGEGKDAAANSSSSSSNGCNNGSGNGNGRSTIIPPEVRIIGRDELDFGGRVRKLPRDAMEF